MEKVSVSYLFQDIKQNVLLSSYLGTCDVINFMIFSDQSLRQWLTGEK